MLMISFGFGGSSNQKIVFEDEQKIVLQDKAWIYSRGGDSMIVYDFALGYGENAYNAHKQPLDAKIGMILDKWRVRTTEIKRT